MYKNTMFAQSKSHPSFYSRRPTVPCERHLFLRGALDSDENHVVLEKREDISCPLRRSPFCQPLYTHRLQPIMPPRRGSGERRRSIRARPSGSSSGSLRRTRTRERRQDCPGEAHQPMGALQSVVQSLPHGTLVYYPFAPLSSYPIFYIALHPYIHVEHGRHTIGVPSAVPLR